MIENHVVIVLKNIEGIKLEIILLFLSINSIKREIMNNGLIQTSFLAYEDLHFYKEDIYINNIN